MKKIFTLFVSSLFSLSLLAYDGTNLTITTARNSSLDLTVEVDGKKFDMQSDRLSLTNLSQGQHNVRIYREVKKKGFGFGFGKKQEIIYATSVILRRGYAFDIMVNRSGNVRTTERRIVRDNDWYDDNYDYGSGTGGGWNGGYANVMGNAEFNSVKSQISKEWFEKNRLTSVKTIMDRNNFTSQQVKELMLLFSFEANKLEVAKYAYRKTVDKQNYYLVNDAFTFSSSKDDLARFIRESRF